MFGVWLILGILECQKSITEHDAPAKSFLVLCLWMRETLGYITDHLTSKKTNTKQQQQKQTKTTNKKKPPFIYFFMVDVKGKTAYFCSKTDLFQIWLQNGNANTRRLSWVNPQMNDLFFFVSKRKEITF